MIWEKVTLGELYTVHNGLSKGRKFFGTGDPFLSFSTVFNNYFIPDELVDLVQSDEKEQKNYSISRGDVFVTRTSETSDELGMSCVALKDYPRATYNGFTKRMRPIAIDRVLPEYIGYYMRMPSFRCKFQAFSTMTTRASLKNEDLLSLTISLPPMEQQIRIAEVLQTYDKLIENNQKQIKLLEEAAQRLYKEWFVDLHFPGYEDVEIVDGVPEGWKITPINMVANLKAGGDKPKIFSKKMTSENKIPVFANGITGKGLMGFTDKAVINNPSVTISARGTVGVVFLRTEPYVPIVRLISVTPIEDKIDILYLYLYLINQNFRSTGAAQQQITVPLLKSKNIVCPTDDVRKSFNNVITPIFNKIEILEKHINKLTESRERLLPKLMSGEIEV